MLEVSSQAHSPPAFAMYTYLVQPPQARLPVLLLLIQQSMYAAAGRAQRAAVEAAEEPAPRASNPTAQASAPAQPAPADTLAATSPPPRPGRKARRGSGRPSVASKAGAIRWTTKSDTLDIKHPAHTASEPVAWLRSGGCISICMHCTCQMADMALAPLKMDFSAQRWVVACSRPTKGSL